MQFQRECIYLVVMLPIHCVNKNLSLMQSFSYHVNKPLRSVHTVCQ